MKPHTYPISEMTETWQGEGPQTGYPVFLIRFAGCNLCCSWCDQAEARDPNKVDWLSLDQVAEQLFNTQNLSVLLTGGEPTQWVDSAFVGLLAEYQQINMKPGLYTPRILLETNGTVPDRDIPTPERGLSSMCVVVSPKYGHPVRLRWYGSSVWLKYVVPGDWPDPDTIVDHVEELGIFPSNVYFQPQAKNTVGSRGEAIAMPIVQSWSGVYHARTGYTPRLSLQAHKFVNIP